MSENNFQHHNRTQITDPIPKSHVFIKWIWAVPEEPGMGCRPRSKILRMFIVYKVFSVILSLLWASPYIYRPFKKLQAKITNVSKKPPRIEIGGAYTTRSVLYAVLGSVALSLLALTLAGYIFWRQQGEDVTPSGAIIISIMQWSARPRATTLVFLANGILVFIDLKRSQTIFTFRTQENVRT